MKNFFRAEHSTDFISYPVPRPTPTRPSPRGSITRNIILAGLGVVILICTCIYCTMQISNFDQPLGITFGTINSPLDQFEIRNLLSLDAPILANLHISLTNIGLYLTITAFIALVLNLLATNYNKVIANS